MPEVMASWPASPRLVSGTPAPSRACRWLRRRSRHRWTCTQTCMCPRSPCAPVTGCACTPGADAAMRPHHMLARLSPGARTPTPHTAADIPLRSHVAMPGRPTRRGWAASRRKPARPARKIPRPIRWAAGAGFRWAAGAGCRFHQTGGPAAASPHGAQGTAGRRSYATRSATCRNRTTTRTRTTTNWRRSRSRPGPRSAWRPRARPAWPPGQERCGTDGSTMSPSLITDRGTSRRPGETGRLALCSQWAGPCDFVAPA